MIEEREEAVEIMGSRVNNLVKAIEKVRGRDKQIEGEKDVQKRELNEM